MASPRTMPGALRRWLLCIPAVASALKAAKPTCTIRALHDGTRRLLPVPLARRHAQPEAHAAAKTEQGWKLLHSNYYNNDENEYYEDKFAVMLARSPVAGGNTVRLGAKPLADKPVHPTGWACMSPPMAAWPTSGTGRACAAARSTSSTTTTSAPRWKPSRPLHRRLYAGPEDRRRLRPELRARSGSQLRQGQVPAAAISPRSRRHGQVQPRRRRSATAGSFAMATHRRRALHAELEAASRSAR